MGRPKGVPLPAAQALALHDACREWHRKKKAREGAEVRQARNEIVREIVNELAERLRLVAAQRELERVKGVMG